MRTRVGPSKFDGPFRAEIKESAPPTDSRLCFERHGGPGKVSVYFEKVQDGSGVRMNVPHDHVIHSPTGFEFGYGGSGPSDLALNILTEFVDPPTAWRLHRAFKDEFVAPIPREGGMVPTTKIYDWLLDRFSEEGD